MEQHMKFNELAFEVMRQRKKDGVRGLDREWSRFRCHVATASFAEADVATITMRDIRDWYRQMAERDCADHGKPRKLSRHSVNRSASLISAVFAEAIHRELRSDNPCVGAKPRRRVSEEDTEDCWSYLTWDEQLKLYACHAIPIEDRLMISIAHDTGMRQAEQYHLERPDLVVAGPDPHVMIRFAGRDNAGKKLPPKSGRPRRVPLLPPALAAARTWLLMLDRWAPHNPENLVFPWRNGRIRNQGKPLGAGGRLKQHYVAAGVPLRPHLHWHALRHTFATNLITGVYGYTWRTEAIRVVMGHSSVTITERYAHIGDDEVSKVARETLRAITAVLEATPDAVNAWEAAPWGG